MTPLFFVLGFFFLGALVKSLRLALTVRKHPEHLTAIVFWLVIAALFGFVLFVGLYFLARD